MISSIVFWDVLDSTRKRHLMGIYMLKPLRLAKAV